MLRKAELSIGLDVHKKTISYCLKDVAGHVHREGKIGSTRRELDAWIKTLPQPRMITIEATIFTGWIYDHLLPHVEKVKVAHPLMLRAIAAAKKKNDRIDAGKIADCLRCDFPPECHMACTEIRDRRRVLRYRNLVVKQMVQKKNRVSGLLNELHHQGDVAVASFATVPFLVRSYQERGVVDRSTYAIVAIIELARKEGKKPDVPQWIMDDYFQAIRKLAEIGSTEILRAETGEDVRAIFSVIAIERSLRIHGRFLVNYSEAELMDIEYRI